MSFRDIAPEEIDNEEPVYIYFDGLPVPFFIESFTTRGTNKALVHLTGIHNLEDAEEVVGQAVYADESLFEDEGDEEFDYESLTGWTILNKDGNKVGTISGFEPIPGNPCVYVDTENAQAMIPLHEDLILDVNYDSCTIMVQIPEGLL